MKVTAEDREKARDQLREWFKPGDTVTTLVRHVTRSGMSRSISVIRGDDDKTYLVARAMDEKTDPVHGGIKVGGCGMDMGFHLVYNLSRTLYPTYECIGRDARCPSNTHVNPGDLRDAYGPGITHSDGYALHQRWL